jgi:hypothetical protein
MTREHEYWGRSSGRGCLEPRENCDFKHAACVVCGKCPRHHAAKPGESAKEVQP